MQQPSQQSEREQQRATEVVLRVDQQRRRVIPGATAEYAELSPPGARSLVMFRMTEAPGKATAESLKHGGDECFVLLAGKHGVDVEGKRYIMERGDVIFIPAAWFTAGGTRVPIRSMRSSCSACPTTWSRSSRAERLRRSETRS